MQVHCCLWEEFQQCLGWQGFFWVRKDPVLWLLLLSFVMGLLKLVVMFLQCLMQVKGLGVWKQRVWQLELWQVLLKLGIQEEEVLWRHPL